MREVRKVTYDQPINLREGKSPRSERDTNETKEGVSKLWYVQRPPTTTEQECVKVKLQPL